MGRHEGGRVGGHPPSGPPIHLEVQVTLVDGGRDAQSTGVEPRVTAPAQRAATPVSTKITTTDYGYVVGELRRIAMLTVILLIVLAGFWLVLG